MKRPLRNGLVAGALAGAVSGAPSTLHALVTGRGPLDATRAAGHILAPRASGTRLVASALVVHSLLSLGWGVALAAMLPRGREAQAGAVAGLGIALLDLAAVGRRIPEVQALPLWPQVADHLAFGAVAGWTLSRLRA